MFPAARRPGIRRWSCAVPEPDRKACETRDRAIEDYYGLIRLRQSLSAHGAEQLRRRGRCADRPADPFFTACQVFPSSRLARIVPLRPTARSVLSPSQATVLRFSATGLVTGFHVSPASSERTICPLSPTATATFGRSIQRRGETTCLRCRWKPARLSPPLSLLKSAATPLDIERRIRLREEADRHRRTDRDGAPFGGNRHREEVECVVPAFNFSCVSYVKVDPSGWASPPKLPSRTVVGELAIAYI